MIIYSKFKDYYDHVAFEYGGGDPLVVYDRSPLIQDVDIGRLPNYSYYISTSEYKYLFCAGEVYILLLYKDGEFKLVTDKLFPKLYSYTPEGKAVKLNTRYYNFLRHDKNLGQLPHKQSDKSAVEKLTHISKLHNLPVFTCKMSCGTGNFILEKQIPRLADLGFASFVNPQQMYQNIAYYIGNTIHTNPDIMPAVENSNSDKIIQHGFDLKQSFRHRK